MASSVIPANADALARPRSPSFAPLLTSKLTMNRDGLGLSWPLRRSSVGAALVMRTSRLFGVLPSLRTVCEPTNPTCRGMFLRPRWFARSTCSSLVSSNGVPSGKRSRNRSSSWVPRAPLAPSAPTALSRNRSGASVAIVRAVALSR